MGRPTTYTKEIAERICELIAGDADARPLYLQDICKIDGMPSRTAVWNWLHSNAEFASMYARAREQAAEWHVAEAQDIADDGRNDYMEKFDKDGNSIGYFFNGEAVQRSKLRVDFRKWTASKWAGGVYGDKLAVEHSGTINFTNVPTEELYGELQQLLATGVLPAPIDAEYRVIEDGTSIDVEEYLEAEGL